MPLMDMDSATVPARPAPYASYPVLVHRLVRLLHASFRPSVAGTPLRFAMTSPPSGCERDFHPQAVEHARHTEKRAPDIASPLVASWKITAVSVDYISSLRYLDSLFTGDFSSSLASFMLFMS